MSRPVPSVPPDMALGAGESPAEQALILGHPDIFSTWSLLPYPEGRLEELVFLSGEFGETLMRYPRAIGALTALLGVSTPGSSAPTAGPSRPSPGNAPPR